MITGVNPFGIVLAVLNFAAAVYEFKSKNPPMGIIYICYGIASVCLALRIEK